jgi:hypothetical protein
MLLEDGSLEYEVEQILGARCDAHGKAKQYFVKWKGFTVEHNSWEPASHVANCADLVAAYWRDKQSKEHVAQQS